MAGKTAGIITINLSAGTSQFIQDMERAKGKVRDFASGGGAGMRQFQSHTVTSMQASSAAIRALEGSMNIRAVEKFMTAILPLGPALQVAFPVVGAVAFIGMITEAGGKVREFYKHMTEAPQRVREAFREINSPLRLSNDELALANDKLDNVIAKLQGKRQNTLAIALDEARIMADNLADALDNNLKKLNELMKKENLGALTGFLTGQASTSQDTESFAKFSREMLDINARGTDAVDAAIAADLKAKDKDQTQTKIAQAKFDAERLGRLDAEITKTKALVEESKKLQQAHRRAEESGAYVPTDLPNPEMSAPVADQSVILEERQRRLENLRSLRNRDALTVAHTQKSQTADRLQTNRDNAQLDQPFRERIKKLNAELEGVKTKLMAAGWGEGAKVIVAAYGESIKVIEEVNKALERHHTKLTAAQEGQIALRVQQIAATQAEENWRAKLATTTGQIKDQIQSQELLTAAIGKGYEAVKAASVETRVMTAVGGEKYNDPQWMKAHAPDVANLRTQFGAQHDAGATEAATKATDSLSDRIELEKSLAAVQIQGAEAVRLVTLAYRLREITLHGVRDANGELTQATKNQLKSEIEAYQVHRALEASTDLAKLQQRIDAIHRLTAAQYEGAEAVRKAALENKYAEMRDAGATPEVISRTRTEDEAAHQEKITAEALKTGIEYKNQLESINQQITALQKIRAERGATFETELALRNLERERLNVLVQESLQMRGARDGVRAFFIEMQQEAKSAANIVYESLDSALDRVSDNFAKFLTGQKTSFAQMFKGLGEDMLKSTIKSAAQKGLGALGKAFGVDIGGLGKPDGSTSDKALWVRMAGGSVGPQLVPPNARSVLFGNGGLLGTGSVPKIMSGPGGMGGPDGSQESPFYVVMEPGRLGSGKPKAKAGGGWLQDLLGIGKSLIPAIGGLFGGGGGGGSGNASVSIDDGGGMASGGLVRPDAAYLVGERGPEILTGASGRILNNTESRRVMGGGGPVNVYNIDNRGTDPVMAEQRTKAGIIAAHASAIGTSVQVNHDMARRVPSKVA